MTELTVYECDRCGKEFKLRSVQSPLVVKFVEANGEVDEYDLCEDCWASMSFAMGEAWEEIDSATESYFDKEEAKEE